MEYELIEFLYTTVTGSGIKGEDVTGHALQFGETFKKSRVRAKKCLIRLSYQTFGRTKREKQKSE